MICQRCKDEGKTSKVYEPQGWLSTLMCSQSYYDEQGKRHHHDPNSRSGSYQCSNGHKWHVTRYTECPSCDYNKAEGEAKYEDSPHAAGGEEKK